MVTVKRLTVDDVCKIIADHFKVSEDKVEFDPNCLIYENWICEVTVE